MSSGITCADPGAGQRTCVICGGSLAARHATAKTCSDECAAESERRGAAARYAAARARDKAPMPLAECVVCGSAFQRRAVGRHPIVTCSNQCRRERQLSQMRAHRARTDDRERERERGRKRWIAIRANPEALSKRREAERKRGRRKARSLTPEETEQRKAYHRQRGVEARAALQVIRELERDLGSARPETRGKMRAIQARYQESKRATNARQSRRPEVRAYRAEYQRRPEVRERMRISSAKFRAAQTAALQVFRALEREIPELDREIEERLAILQQQLEAINVDD